MKWDDTYGKEMSYSVIQSIVVITKLLYNTAKLINHRINALAQVSENSTNEPMVHAGTCYT